MNATLTSHYWDLQSIGNPQGTWRSPAQSAGQAAPRLTFTEGRVVASRLCNTISAAYQTQGERLQVQQPISTLMGCSDPQLAALEQMVGRQLSQAQRYQMQQGEQPVLTIAFEDGVQWRLQGTPTAQTRYGSAPERMFLEVAPGTQPCTHGVMTQHQCLRVREIRYNDNGIKTFTGEWQNFYEPIEGFTQRPGERNVLRVHRYARRDVPADASRYAYVLDMIVESARAP